MKSKTLKNDSKNVILKSRATKSEVKKATRKGIAQYANALKELARR